MQLQHTFSVPIDPQSAFVILEDIRRVARCMPGATVDRLEDDGSFTGEVVVRVGPMQFAYRGKGRWTDFDEDRGVAVMEAKGREVRGNGTVKATITVHLQSDDGTVTEATVDTDLRITGQPAQFGKGVVVDVADRILSEFVECLKAEISAGRRTGSGRDVFDAS